MESAGGRAGGGPCGSWRGPGAELRCVLSSDAKRSIPTSSPQRSLPIMIASAPGDFGLPSPVAGSPAAADAAPAHALPLHTIPRNSGARTGGAGRPAAPGHRAVPQPPRWLPPLAPAAGACRLSAHALCSTQMARAAAVPPGGAHANLQPLRSTSAAAHARRRRGAAAEPPHSLLSGSSRPTGAAGGATAGSMPARQHVQQCAHQPPPGRVAGTQRWRGERKGRSVAAHSISGGRGWVPVRNRCA